MEDVQMKSTATLWTRSAGEMPHQTAARWPQYLAALIACIGSFILGTALGWTSTSATRLEVDLEYGFVVSTSEFSLLSALMPIGALVVTPVAGWLVSTMGRKPSMMLLCVPAAAGYAVIAWAQNVAMFYVGRILLGVACGGFSVVVPMYTGEYSQPEVRGTLGTYFQLMLTVGTLFTYVIGWVVNVFWLTILCLIFPVLFFVLALLVLPESPIYYLEKNEFAKAKKSLQWFRGKDYNIEVEFEIMQANIEESKSQKMSLREAFSTRTAMKALLLNLGLMFFQQFSGVNAIIFYTVTIFQDAGSTLNSNLCTIIVGVVAVVVTYISSLIIDKLGRRPLLLLSDSVMALCTLVVGLYFTFKDQNYDVSAFSWAPVTFVCIFIVAFDLGFGPIPWTYLGEVFPRQVAGYAVAITCMFNYICVFLITYFFESVSDAVSKGGTFFGFTVISVLGTVFVFFMIVETKNKTLERILEEL